MRCIVTAGATYEPLDQARRLTNFSTGRLGSDLAAFLEGQGHEVTLLIAEQAVWRAQGRVGTVRPFTTTLDLLSQFGSMADDTVSGVFHAAAVSDFAFGKVWSRDGQGNLTEMRVGKLSTRQGTLLAELTPTPKVIAHLRGWFPRALIVGWKYEVDGRQGDVLGLAQHQMAECRTNACVANGPAFGPGFGLVQSGRPPLHLADSPALFAELHHLLSRFTSPQVVV